MFFALSPIRKLAICATSSAELICLSGCLLFALSMASSFLKMEEARGVLVSVGAMQFTLILGANSAANDRVNPSIAPLAAAIEA